MLHFLLTSLVNIKQLLSFLQITRGKIIPFLFLFVSVSLNAQRDISTEKIGTSLLGFHFGLNQPTNDLENRFGLLNHIGIMSGYKTKRNWFFGIDGNFIFGNTIKETSLLDNLKDDQGNITDLNGDIAQVILSGRGFNTNLTVGKIIPIVGPNKNSGIFIHSGIGIIEHKIRIESNKQVIPQVELEYKKGYDRLALGYCIHEFIGYIHLSNNGRINFYGGFYAQQGFTKNQRTLNFDQADVKVSTLTRKDFSYGFKVGWFIPIYKRQTKEYYYN
jgi:hypothetical protein